MGNRRLSIGTLTPGANSNESNHKEEQGEDSVAFSFLHGTVVRVRLGLRRNRVKNGL
jgi:hypothetical protein